MATEVQVEVDVRTATEELLLSCTMQDLREFAREIGVKFHGKTRTVLVAEIMAARDALNASGESAVPTEEEPASEPLSVPESTQVDVTAAAILDAEEEEPDEITPDEARKFDQASEENITEWLRDRAAEARVCLVSYAYLVLERRRIAREEREAKLALESQIEQFEVTKGGKVGIGGFWVNLPVGSIVARHTHDLEALQKQGIEARPVRRVSVEPDNIGVVRTKIEL